MKRILNRSLAAVVIALAAGSAQAGNPVVGAVIGAGAGAMIGQAFGGNDGAAIGGAIGAVAGAVAAQEGGHRHGPPAAVVETAPVYTQVGYYGGNGYYGGGHGYHGGPPRHAGGHGPGHWARFHDRWGAPYWVWQPIAPVYVHPPRRVYAPPIYVPPPVYLPRPGYRGPDHHYHHRGDPRHDPNGWRRH